MLQSLNIQVQRAERHAIYQARSSGAGRLIGCTCDCSNSSRGRDCNCSRNGHVYMKSEGTGVIETRLSGSESEIPCPERQAAEAEMMLIPKVWRNTGFCAMFSIVVHSSTARVMIRMAQHQMASVSEIWLPGCQSDSHV